MQIGHAQAVQQAGTITSLGAQAVTLVGLGDGVQILVAPSRTTVQTAQKVVIV